jgi:DNA-binding transcriptional LysR family regulator
MELHHLRTFCEVVRERSFTAAARKLFLTQPAVSQQIKALETEIGERLLERTGRDVRPTDAGLLLLETAEKVLRELDDGTARIREARDEGEGTVVIACGDTTALYLLPPALAAFRAEFPKADVAVHCHGSPEVLAEVLSGGADLGVATESKDLDPALESGQLLEEDLVLAVPPGHRFHAAGPKSLAELAGEAAVLLARPATTRAVIDEGLAHAGIELDPTLESGNFEVVKAYVARGFGISILPVLAITDDDRRRFAVHPLPGVFPRRRLMVVRRRDRYRGKLVKRLTAILAEEMKALRGARPTTKGRRADRPAT